MTELFAPILTVMKAKNLKEAIEIVNSTGYGLTAGFESLDEREWEYFHTHIEAGNIYINKPTTGAIVLRQPFGGVKKSAIGFGRKVGIYNYITQFLDISQDNADENLLENELTKALENINLDDKDCINKLTLMAKSYVYHYQNEFCLSKDYVGIRGEENLFSYTKIKNLAFRVCKEDNLQDILGVSLAASILKIKLLISFDENENITKAKEVCEKLNLNASFIKEKLEDFVAKIDEYERIRYHAKPSVDDEIYIKAASLAKIIIRDKPILNGRVELLFYHNEKSLSISYHRYGNLGIRALKK